MNAGRDVHGIYKNQPLLNTAFSDQRFHILVYGDDLAALRDIHPDFLGETLHCDNLSGLS